MQTIIIQQQQKEQILKLITITREIINKKQNKRRNAANIGSSAA